MSEVPSEESLESGGRCSWEARDGKWPLERILFAMAGTVTILSAALAALVSPWFLILTALVGINQWMYVLVGACPASIVLGKAFGFRSVTQGASR